MIKLTAVTAVAAFSFSLVTFLLVGADSGSAFLSALWTSACLAATVACLAPIPRIIREGKATRAIIRAETAEIIRQSQIEIEILEAETAEIVRQTAALDRKTALLDIETTAMRAWRGRPA